MKESLHFYYDGQYSADKGLVNCKIDDGLFEDVFLAEREINEIEIRGRSKPYFQEVKRLPLEFSLSFVFVERYDENKIREVARWLDTDSYKPFYTEINPEIVFYCTLSSSSSLLHNGLRQGYVELTMRCDSPYAYSPQLQSKKYEWREEVLSLKDDSFSGEKNNLVLDNGSLVLNPVKTIWSNLSPNMVWNEL